MNAREIIGLIFLAAASESAFAQSEASALYSVELSAGVSATAAILEALPASAELVVEGVVSAGKTSVVLAKATSTGVEISFEVSSDLAAEAAMAAGSVIEVTTSAAGHLLIASGQAVAFIPNALGRSLIHRRELRQ